MLRRFRSLLLERTARREAAGAFADLEGTRSYWEGYIALVRLHGGQPIPPMPLFATDEQVELQELLGKIMASSTVEAPTLPYLSNHAYRGVLVQDPFSDAPRTVDTVQGRFAEPSDIFHVHAGFVTRIVGETTQTWADPGRVLEEHLYHLLERHGWQERLEDISDLPWSTRAR